jgi:hypothetical protein
MSINFLKNITALLALCVFLNISDCFAWAGYDNFDGSEIEISSGNLVREGETIKFYDWGSEEDRNAEVRSIDYLFSATRVEIYDFVTQKVRVFDMDN